MRNISFNYDGIKVFKKNSETEFHIEAIVRVLYEGVCIAKFQGKGEERDLESEARSYVKTYGYMAEHRKKWNCKEFAEGKNFVQWQENA